MQTTGERYVTGRAPAAAAGQRGSLVPKKPAYGAGVGVGGEGGCLDTTITNEWRRRRTRVMEDIQQRKKMARTHGDTDAPRPNGRHRRLKEGRSAHLDGRHFGCSFCPHSPRGDATEGGRGLVYSVPHRMDRGFPGLFDGMRRRQRREFLWILERKKMLSVAFHTVHGAIIGLLMYLTS